MSEENKIDWDYMASGDYIKLEDGEPKTLLLKNWKPQTQFKDEKTKEVRAGVVFEVWAEDDKVYEEKPKEWTVTAKGALSQFAPLCKAAEAEGKMEVKVTVIAVGEGKDRKYSVKPAV